MSKQNLVKTVSRELEIINDVIDKKILMGMRYVKESHRHKILLSRLAMLRRSAVLTRSLTFF